MRKRRIAIAAAMWSLLLPLWGMDIDAAVSIGKSDIFGIGFSGAIGAPITESITIESDISYLNGTDYEAVFTTRYSVFSWWDVGGGLLFFTESNAIVPALRFQTSLKAWKIAGVMVSYAMGLNETDLFKPYLHRIDLNFQFNGKESTVAMKLGINLFSPEAFKRSEFSGSMSVMTSSNDNSLFFVSVSNALAVALDSRSSFAAEIQMRPAVELSMGIKEAVWYLRADATALNVGLGGEEKLFGFLNPSSGIPFYITVGRRFSLD